MASGTYHTSMDIFHKYYLLNIKMLRCLEGLVMLTSLSFLQVPPFFPRMGQYHFATGAGGSGSAIGSIVHTTAAMISESINMGKSGGFYLATVAIADLCPFPRVR